MWKHLLERAQQRDGIRLGLPFLDATTIPAHRKTAGAAKKAALPHSAAGAKRLAAHVADFPPMPA
ncbi:MAG TPA: hypothetical protein VGC82_14115 [Rhodopila sp.]